MPIGGVLCHLNGDQYVLSSYNGFDTIYVITTKDRLEIKLDDFRIYDKIKVLGF